MKNILLYFDTNRRASLFDILFAYDVGFDIVEPISGVTAEEVTALVQDAMFPRGPKGAQATTFYFGGDDLDLVEKLAKKAQKTMFPPFQLSIALDPKGAYTTSSAAVAKAMEGLAAKEQALAGKTAAILGGCGRVGRVAARIMAAEGVTVKLFDIVDQVQRTAAEIAEDTGSEVEGIRAATAGEIIAAANDADIVLSAGPAGVQILPADALAQLERCVVALDINAVPPAGIEGLKAKYDKEERDGVLLIGALAIGDLRNKIARKMFKAAMASEGAFLDYKDAFAFAREKVGL
jgi:methylene-tetrahydromethanopterin dehydrogenase